jgi:site-specific DNA recombinase
MPKPAPAGAKVFRCAIYTRKSSEEGLEQAFNSLHAQRESCEAYIKSQRHEGWTPLPSPYDDGGYSGGSTERPALKRLLADVQSRLIDVVVVYKVDRLTRSLADFAKIVEIFDAAGVSFVSVTQQFNTTTSMGRLTLNVLLSFAQFEREVTGERIRDKIAASKQKGMWMGGWVPIGYDRKDRTLTVNEREAATVRAIFDLFVRLKNVQRVQDELARLKLTTKPYATPRGRAVGGLSFSRGHLYKILSNPLYIGEIEHKGARYPGQHPPLIDAATWEAVQAQLAANHHENRTRNNAKSKSLLAGLIYDGDGNRLVSSHATKNGKRYRYYVTSVSVGRSVATTGAPRLWLPAVMIDRPASADQTGKLSDE